MDWRLYAIYRLEHWGLSTINNVEVSDAEILEANRIYGSLGELAVMVMPQVQLNNLVKKLDIGNIKDDCPDYMASVKDSNLREILAKEILTYEPPQNKTSDVSESYSKLSQLMKVRILLSNQFIILRLGKRNIEQTIGAGDNSEYFVKRRNLYAFLFSGCSCFFS